MYFDYGTLFDIKEFSEFKFLDWVEKTDERWKYIEMNWKKIYQSDYASEDAMSYEIHWKWPNSCFVIGYPGVYVITLKIISYRTIRYVWEPSQIYRYREDDSNINKSVDFTNIPRERDFIIDEKYVEEIMNKS